MKKAFTYLFLFFMVTSCEKKQEVAIHIDEIIIPKIEKNRLDTKFELKNGVLLYDNVSFSGIVNEYYSEGKIKSTSEYFKGKRQGFYKGFYIDGDQTFERFYTNGLKTGNHKGWYENGNLMFDYQFNDSGQYHGEVKDWFKNGNLQKHFNFVEGKESGSQKMWDINGKIRANFYTINGERHGLIGLKKCISVQTKKNETI